MCKHNIIKVIPWLLVVMTLFLLTPFSAFSEFRIGEDIEKPKPEFTREGDTIAAKLIPRAKSTSVVIRFKVDGGKLDAVKGIDFYTCDRPEVDIKNFKSALFEVDASGMKKGGEVKVSIVSEFFISSTQYYAFNETLEKPWMIPDIQNISLPNRVQKLVIPVKDGGPYDSDGTENGRIRFIGGPRDSFWGYALGTLFIRFFGIFLVLSVLMVGMILSGRFFNWYLSRNSASKGSGARNEMLDPIMAPETDEPELLTTPTSNEKSVSDPIAAAIAMAIHLHLSASKEQYPAAKGKEHTSNAWAKDGRSRMMNDRLMIYNR